MKRHYIYSTESIFINTFIVSQNNFHSLQQFCNGMKSVNWAWDMSAMGKAFVFALRNVTSFVKFIKSWAKRFCILCLQHPPFTPHIHRVRYGALAVNLSSILNGSNIKTSSFVLEYVLKKEYLKKNDSLCSLFCVKRVYKLPNGDKSRVHPSPI